MCSGFPKQMIKKKKLHLQAQLHDVALAWLLLLTSLLRLGWNPMLNPAP